MILSSAITDFKNIHVLKKMFATNVLKDSYDLPEALTKKLVYANFVLKMRYTINSSILLYFNFMI